MSKLSGKVRNTATKAVSNIYSPEEIERRSLEGEHNGESMMAVFQKIMSDPNLEKRETGKGVYDLVYTKDDKEDIIGWLDANRGIGEISQKGYDRLRELAPESIRDLGDDLIQETAAYDPDVPHTRDAYTQEVMSQLQNGNRIQETAAYDPNVPHTRDADIQEVMDQLSGKDDTDAELQ